MGALVGHAGITGANLIRNKGKGSTEEHLPSRMVMSELTKGDPVQRSMGNYAKVTPGVGDTSPSILNQSMISNKKHADKF
jgi:hypothetical protein